MAEFLLFLLSTVSVIAAWVLSYGLTPERRRAQRLRPLLLWSGKGLLVPLAIWALMNFGLQYLHYIGNMATLRFGDSFFQNQPVSEILLEKVENTCAMIVPALVLVFFGGWSMLGLAGIAVLAPMAGYGASVLHIKPMPPIYARAVARMKFGKYPEAEREIIHELERCEDDFDGWMMLADLYANQFNDLPEAEQSILEICEQPKTTPSQLSVALHRLADWHLHRAGDPAAAQRALQMICDRLPGSHLAHMAQLRMNQLPATTAELRQQQGAATIPLPALSDTIDETLKRDPNNVPARERLARLFAEQLDQPDQGIEQVTLLLDMPDQLDARKAEWLGLIAAWHIRFRQDADAGRKTLERLLREFPKCPQALAARRRLQLLDADSRA